MHQWRMLFLWTVLTLIAVAGAHAQEKPAVFLDPNKVAIQLRTQPQTQTPGSKRLLTLDQAVEIFMRQNLQLVAARYDIETAEAEKLTARLRPNPQFTVGLADLIHRCLAYNAHNRPERMSEVQGALDHLAEELVTSPDYRLEALEF